VGQKGQHVNQGDVLFELIIRCRSGHGGRTKPSAARTGPRRLRQTWFANVKIYGPYADSSPTCNRAEQRAGFEKPQHALVKTNVGSSSTLGTIRATSLVTRGAQAPFSSSQQLSNANAQFARNPDLPLSEFPPGPYAQAKAGARMAERISITPCCVPDAGIATQVRTIFQLGRLNRPPAPVVFPLGVGTHLSTTTPRKANRLHLSRRPTRNSKLDSECLSG